VKSITESYPKLNLTKIQRYIQSEKKELWMDKTNGIFKYRNWPEIDKLRLIFLYPFLFLKFGEKDYLTEISKRLKRTKGSIRVMRLTINEKLPNLIKVYLFNTIRVMKVEFIEKTPKNEGIRISYFNSCEKHQYSEEFENPKSKFFEKFNKLLEKILK
jgi:hypothetical protein